MDNELIIKAALAIGLVIILTSCLTGHKRENYMDYLPADSVPANSTLGATALLPVNAELLPSKERPKIDYGAFAPPSIGQEKQNYLDPVQFIGISSVSGSLRNPSYDIRSSPINPRIPNLTPFMNSTIVGDAYRRPLDCP
jgi:hypothetical protein